MMELLSGQGRKVGFFRPVIGTGDETDLSINLIASRYNLEFPYEAMYGCTHETARELILDDRHDELTSRILDKYKALEKQCDFVVSSGTDFTAAAAAFEFDFNLDLANNLGCSVLPVVNGLDGQTRKIVNTVKVLFESLEKKKCDTLAIIINRVPGDRVDDVAAELKESVAAIPPVYVVAENPLLGKPTVGEIASALNAAWLRGQGDVRDRVITNYKVAAMELPHFLDHLEEDSLIITPGDRSDIILGTLLAEESRAYPRVAGILLTGDLKPAAQVLDMIEGLDSSKVPVLSVPTDTFTTATAVSSIEGSILPENKRKIAAALGIMEEGIDISELEVRILGVHPTRTTPIMFEYDLIQRAKEKRQHIVLPEGTDERILRAAEILLLRGVVDLTILGNPDELRQKIGSIGLSLDLANFVSPAESDMREAFAETYFTLREHKGISKEMAHDAMTDVSYFGTMMVHSGVAGGMVSGAAHTTQHTIRPALEIIKTRPDCSIVSSIFFMCLADRVLVYGDCAVNPNPTAEQLADIAVSSAETAQMFGIEPRVAMLSYSTGESGKGGDVERVREATGIARKLQPGLKLEGPIQYDAAVDPGVARSKMPESEVAGRATVFIFPDLNTGNNTYKAVQRSANALAIGPVLQGLNKPVNDLSRGCTVADIVNTIAITAIQAQGEEK
jgi:phosphate acetyltransferase